MAIQPAYRDAERTNNSPRSAKIYKDLNLNFGRHPSYERTRNYN